MDYFLAKNNKQLGVCLRMLFAEDIQGTVKTVMNGKDRIEFHIHANVDKQTMIFKEEIIMTVKGNAITPVKQDDGTWDVIAVPYEEEIEDLGREHLMCNICGFGGYPECMKDCKAYLPQRAKSLGPAPEA